MYKEMSLFILPPLAIAAETQLGLLQQRPRDSGLSTYHANREIRHTLEITCAAIGAFSCSTGQYELLFRECTDALRTYSLGKSRETPQDRV